MNRVMSAGLYELPRGILIHAYAPTKAGFLIAVEPSALLPPMHQTNEWAPSSSGS